MSFTTAGDALVLAEHGRRWLRFSAPADTFVAWHPGEVRHVLETVEGEVARRGCHAVGMVAFEAGAAYGLATHQAPADLPLAWFAIYPAAIETEPPGLPPPWHPRSLAASLTAGAYADAFARVKQYIADGDCYQVNATFHLRAEGDTGASAAFAQLVHSQRGRYAIGLRLLQHTIGSASPELFFARRGSTIVCRPMKGSAPRGRWPDEDRAAWRWLRASPKDRAENVMVVDMVRNDLGRIARTGTVRVRQMFAIERYPTIWQMTSEVAAETTAGLADIFEAMFPSASITGAPKVRVMEIIKAIEPSPRGVYTGALGYLAPDGTAQFSVAIRTFVVDHLRQALTFGVGSGIVWDSRGEGEYAECLLKGRVLEPGPGRFALLETLAWAPGEGFTLLDAHLDRLQRSAAYFGVPLSRALVGDTLERAVAPSGAPCVVRLLVDQTGRPSASTRPMPREGAPARVCLSREPIDAADIFYFHKTTRRAEYDRRLCARCDDVVLWNDAGEVTETTIANVVLNLDGALVTPPVASGLLAGTFRGRLLAEGRVSERRVRMDDLARAEEIWLVNSVRGWRRAELVRHAP